MSSIEERLAAIEGTLNELKNEWRVHKKLSVGNDIDKQVVIEDGKVDGINVSEDGIVLDGHTNKLVEHDTKLVEHDTKLGGHQSNITTNMNKITTVNNQLTAHSTNQSNPHQVTAAQVRALPKTGGTITGNITATNVTATEKVSGENGKFDQLIECKNLKVNNSVDIYHNLYFISNSQHTPSIRFLNSSDGADFTYEIYKDKVNGRLVIAPKAENQVKAVVEIKAKLIGGEHIHQSSSIELKSNISKLSSNTAIDILKKLNPVKYRYKNEKEKEENLGFIAEEVPDILSDKDHKTVKIMDIVAALVKVVQEQQNEIEKLKRIKYNSKNI